jgi:NAD(P)-dependent dehydrogenase (short-subunit alcohol dehydrogenase family)
MTTLANQKLTKPVAIVIGGLGGIGSVIVDYLGKQDVQVIAADQNAREFQVDATDEKSVQQLVNRVVKRFGRIDYLVNAAGMFFMKPIEETSLEEWNKMLDMNLKIIFLTCRAITPIMKKQKYGKIVNIASHAAHKKFPNQVAYKA